MRHNVALRNWKGQLWKFQSENFHALIVGQQREKFFVFMDCTLSRFVKNFVGQLYLIHIPLEREFSQEENETNRMLIRLLVLTLEIPK